jgi:hypothetical protein
MKIDIGSIPKVWINLEKNIDRKQMMEEQFSFYGIQNHYRLEGIEKLDNPVLGCGLSMLAAITYARKNLPCIVMEDDAAINEDGYDNFIEIPDEADAVYLGISHWGMSQGGRQSTLNGINRSIVNENLMKIDSMCSLHSVLYISEKYTDAVLQAIEQRIELNSGSNYYGNDGHIDIGTALIQKDFNVFAPIVPYFYQKCKKNEIFTKIPLNHWIGFKQ